MQLQDLDPQQARRLSALLDEAAELPLPQRAAWQDELARREPQLHRLVTDLLATMDRPGREHRLETGELIERRFAQATREAPALEGRSFGPYRVLRLLGRGGMGTVWLAERADGLFERQVALKLVQIGLIGHSFSERFARERGILAALDHPHIARLLDAGVADDGQPYLALDYVDGAPLTAHCDTARLGVEARIALVVQVLSAVQHAHQNLVVHRDLKPSNILVTADGQAHLLDFGIAKLMVDGQARETELTELGGRALTPDYASPEQITGQPVSTASDVYSLGVVLYELLCGQRPYHLSRDSRGALEDAILNAEPVRPSQCRSSVDIAAARSTTPKRLARSLAGDLDTIVLKALKKHPAERYATADAFQQDLQRYLADEPIAARPDSTVYRARKFVWRNKFAVASAMSVSVALAVGFGVALWQARVANREARTAAAVQTFLGDIFRANSSLQPDPVKARETTARALLDAGAAKIGDSLQDAPEGKLSVLAMLANLYDDLGLAEKTVALQRQRVALAKSTYGNWHPEVADALIGLSGALHESSEVNEREAVLREAQAILDRRGDQRSTARGELDLQLAEAYQSTDLAKTIDFAHRAVEIFRAYPASFSLVQVLTMEGIAYDARTEYREAVAALVEAGDVARALPAGARRTEPIIHAYLAEARFNLADFAGAEASYRQALRLATSLRGQEHEDTIQTQLRLGTFLVSTGRATEGLALLRAAKELVIRTKGANDIFHLPRVLSNYGSALIRHGQAEAGVVELSAAIELRRRQRSGTRMLAQILENEAPGLIALGRYAQAATQLDEASAIRTQIGDKPATAQLVGNALARAELAMATGRLDDVAKAIDGLAPAATGGTDRLSQRSLAIQNVRAKAALALGRVAESIDRAAAVRGAIEASASGAYLKEYEFQASLIEGKGQLLRRHAGDALPRLQRAVGLGSELYDQEHSLALADAQVALAEGYLELGQRDEAKKSLKQAEAIHAATPNAAERDRSALRAVAAKLAGAALFSAAPRR